MVFNQAAKRTTLHWLPIHDQISSFEHCLGPSLPQFLYVQICTILGSSFFIILSNIFAIVLMSALQWQGPMFYLLHLLTHVNTIACSKAISFTWIAAPVDVAIKGFPSNFCFFVAWLVCLPSAGWVQGSILSRQPGATLLLSYFDEDNKQGIGSAVPSVRRRNNII